MKITIDGLYELWADDNFNTIRDTYACKIAVVRFIRNFILRLSEVRHTNLENLLLYRKVKLRHTCD